MSSIAYSVDELIGLGQDRMDDLYYAMSKDSALYNEIICPSWCTDETPVVHKEVYGNLDEMTDGDYRNLALVVYRGFAKSSIKRSKFMQEVSYGLEQVNLWVSESKDQAASDLATVKNEFDNNPRFQLFFNGFTTEVRSGNNKKKSKDNAFDTIFYRDKNPSDWSAMMCRGMTGKVRGLNVNGVRPNKLVLDDFESEENSATKAGRAKVRARLLSAFLPALDKKTGKMVLQGTIVHPEAYLNMIKQDVLEGNPTVYSGSMGKYFERALSSDPHNYGVGTWPEYHDKQWWYEKKLQYKPKDFWQFMQEYYNTPKQLSDPKFNIDMIKPVNARFVKYRHINYLHCSNGIKLPLRTFIGCDPAYSFRDDSDNTVMCVVGVDPYGNYYILEWVIDSLDHEDKISTIIRLKNKYGVTLTTIESFGAALELPNSLERYKRESGDWFPIKTFEKRVSKAGKFIEGLTPEINSGKLLYLAGLEGMDIFFDEAKSFSGEERSHDDTLDGLYLAMINASKATMMSTGDLDAMIDQARSSEKLYNPCNTKLNAKTSRRNLLLWR